MSSKEEAFLQYYVAAGLSPGKKVECYRLAFGKEAEGVQDSSVETYAKRLLATKEAKAYIKQHRPNDVVRSEQLLDAIKELNELLQVNSKVSDILAIRREIRLHLSDLAKCVDVVEATKQSEWAVSDGFVKVTAPIDVNDPKSLNSYVRYLSQPNKAARLFLVNGGIIKELIVVAGNSELNIVEVEERMKNEQFGLAFRVSN